MNTVPPNGYRRIYPSDPSHRITHSQPSNETAHTAQSSHPHGRNHQQHQTGRHAFREQEDAFRQNSSQPAGARPAIRSTNPHDWSRDSGGSEHSSGGDSRHIHFHHYYAYFLPPSPTRPQPQVPTTIGRAFDERRKNGCAPTCLVLAALALGIVIALLVMAMGLALVGQMLSLPSAVPPALPTPPHFTPTSSGEIARSLDLAILPFPGRL
ncbi:MAG TPA: hypothetical protein VH591_10575 [Ktedonobacterales bacterium]